MTHHRHIRHDRPARRTPQAAAVRVGGQGSGPELLEERLQAIWRVGWQEKTATIEQILKHMVVEAAAAGLVEEIITQQLGRQGAILVGDRIQVRRTLRRSTRAEVLGQRADVKIVPGLCRLSASLRAKLIHRSYTVRYYSGGNVIPCQDLVIAAPRWTCIPRRSTRSLEPLPPWRYIDDMATRLFIYRFPSDVLAKPFWKSELRYEKQVIRPVRILFFVPFKRFSLVDLMESWILFFHNGSYGPFEYCFERHCEV